MAEQHSAPRVTAAYLDRFVGRIVTLVGKVTQLRGEQATLEADGIVTVFLNRVSALAHPPITKTTIFPFAAPSLAPLVSPSKPSLPSPLFPSAA